MKKIYSLKNLFIALFAVLTITAPAQAPVTHTINFAAGAVQNVTVATNDVLEFHCTPTYSINLEVIFRNLVTPNNISNIAIVPASIISYTVLANDTSYWVKDNNTNPYSVKGRITITTSTGIKQTFISNSVKLFPNPASNTIKITAVNKETLSILNITGQTLIESAVDAGTSDIDVSQLSPGIYFVRLGKERLKLIKE